MQGNRRKDTEPELLLRAALGSMGVRGYSLDLKDLPGRPDIAFTRWRLAVLVHGCFWHRCPHCRPALPKRHRAFWKRKFELNAERDERKRRQLEAAGWEVLEFWECEVRRNAGDCARRVKGALLRIRAGVDAVEEGLDLEVRVRRTVPRRSQRGRA